MSNREPKARNLEGPNGKKSKTPASFGDAMRQKTTDEVELPSGEQGEARGERRSGEASTAECGNARSGTDHLMEEVVEASNLKAALKRVKQNKGSPGVDGMSVMELSAFLTEHWRRIRDELLTGIYQPTSVKEQQIRKRDGGIRKLGIPTVLDRFIQQAILQVLQPRIDPTFSEHSYGFRPLRSAHDAVRAAQKYIQGGKTWVVDVDLEKMFDTVNHDVLMAKMAKRIADKRMLGLIRRYLNAGIMADGVTTERYEGTPQGGPLSPLLANVLLDDVDRELEKRGHAFCRYADDCNVYVGSQRAGEDVMQLLVKLYAKLRLKVNASKSAVARPWERKFLGYSFFVTEHDDVKRSVAPKALEAMKERVRDITDRNGGRSMSQVADELRSYLPGWRNYFSLADTPEVFRALDDWIRRRLRVLQLKQWKRGTTVYVQLRKRGLSHAIAARVAQCSRRYWWVTQLPQILMALPDQLFDALRIPRLAR